MLGGVSWEKGRGGRTGEEKNRNLIKEQSVIINEVVERSLSAPEKWNPSLRPTYNSNALDESLGTRRI
jgi:hypothetical protein